MQRFWSAWPVYLLLADLIYGLGLNLADSLSLRDSRLSPAAGLPVAPEIAFSGLQLLANGGMVLVMAWGFVHLLRLNRHVVHKQPYPLTPLRLTALGVVLAFSLPAWWHGAWSLWALTEGRLTFAWDNPRYLAFVILQPYPAALCLLRLWQNRTRKTGPTPSVA
nr:hypothetical protein [Neisseria sp. HSC-16F19]